ncbi:uncharacterized protein K460DRAFT_376291 [Cucurbitaria berberidis CBS 394.84]|uniref:Uncharacterized protein n=1 Tax=Cucurbitaria berberidis CBS 394.84 TaxID=1168544 RepID=A0A9P4GFF6_9PLEO|nr:uncharacterized protein K460DRAFT_376291 [Cucurbitaria berberidis CBS 394.84]KAF1844637.1 hypothetical protein K460DRAFT_376291 [Cucurbitaria berberidis CBS 394.84]
MLLDAQLLTILTTFTTYRPEELSSAPNSLLASDFLLLQVRPSSPQEGSEPMAHHHQRLSRTQNENELWFNMPSSERVEQERARTSEQSAYRATSNRISMHSTNSRSTPRIPTIFTSSDVNKPLPPSPSDSERRKRKPASLREIIRRQKSDYRDSNHLRPEPYPQRYSSLSVDTHSHHHHHYSRSMPSSPFEYDEVPASPNPATIPRASSAAANYPDETQYQPYLPPPPQQQQQEQQYTRPIRQQRAISMNTYFDTAPPRARTFPEPTALGPPAATARENVSNRPRPHTWLSPTEPFTDISQFHLFAEATTGLPDDPEPFSPNAPPQLQGSLFARRSHNDIIPLPLQYSMAPPAQSSSRTDWQNFEPPEITPRSASARPSRLPIPQPYQQWQPPPQMDTVTMELEMLGLSDEHVADDELPDYAQSQAEMDAKRREEAGARARDLEARWRGARGARGR